ncbi:MAG: hypothetical protein ABI693_34250 [Bryobacteraceae bacterium]
MYPDRDLTAAAHGTHRAEFGYPMDARADPQQESVRKAGVQVTPEAAVFVGDKLVYCGRIDDRYVDFGQSRATPAQRDLDEALAAIAAGKPLPFDV